MNDFDELFRLMYADQPDQVRYAGGPWVGVAKTVERAMAVLEDGQRKLAEVWRSPGGTAYVAEMGRVVEAMRAASEAARHNDQVMSAAADALDGKQKDFAILSTAPIPADARERYARAIVNSLDEDYQQAVANFRPVPAIRPPRDKEQPLAVDGQGSSSSLSGGAGSAGTRPSASSGTTPKRLPSWVPTQSGEQAGQASSHGGNGGTGMAAGSGGGPTLEGVGSAAPAPPQAAGSWSGVDTPEPGTFPGPGRVPGEDAWPGQPSAGTPTGGVNQPAPGRRDATARSSTRRLASPPGGGGLAASEPGGVASGRATAAGRPASMIGGVPVGGSGASAGRSWSGYRRRPEPFPTNRRTVVPPVIVPAMAEEESEPDEVATEYSDDFGNRITIRRPCD